MQEKKDLRLLMLKKRGTINPQSKQLYDNFICEKLLEIIEESNAKVVHAYIPMASEINISPLIQQLLDKKITVVSPKTLKNRQLQNLILHSLNELETGIAKTQHPANSTEYQGKYDLIIVPGLAFDKQNYRLGYGGGYYDGFLATQPNALKIGIFYPFQEVQKVPTEPHDQQLTSILVKQSAELF
ncbi:MAG: 5-formyltetrahydrofolate cyclo-ligase [Flavobacteriales bacterium]|nr:5-formyltetrahydrofolate cyclo-ligase [Flavobacteriales bacterium]MCL4856600.1 5-formyltetrahydrofolate cyclo-ligase [Flavobacteriales bacterium]